MKLDTNFSSLCGNMEVIHKGGKIWAYKAKAQFIIELYV